MARKSATVDQLFYENKNKSKYHCIAGADEVGRGCLAGPVVSAMVILNLEVIDKRINDSKQVSESVRVILNDIIKKEAAAWSVGIIYPGVIDKINILNATKASFKQCFEKILPKPDLVLMDGLTVEDMVIPQEKIIRGDQKSYSIAAASIIAKVFRDAMMIDYDKQFPQYQFAKNKGYGTKSHFEAIKQFGPCEIHRYSFAPIKNWYGKKELNKT